MSALGSDSADGLTEATAWKTPQKVNTVSPTGANVLFRRGDTFYGSVNPAAGTNLGAYGAGERPILTAYKLLNQAAGWTQHAAGVWKIDLTSPTTHTGLTASTNTNIGFLLVDGALKVTKRVTLAELAAPWDFYSDAQYLYVQATGNPTTLATSIQAAPCLPGLVQVNSGRNVIRDLHLTGNGGHGVRGNNGASDVRVRDCLIDYIGGSFLIGSGDNTTRYGNGIELWIGSNRWLVDNNEVAYCYDVAFTAQGTSTATAIGWSDIMVRGNSFHDCTQSVEFWSDGTVYSGGGFVRVVIDANQCARAGWSPWTDVRPNTDTRVHLLTYNWVLPADITIQNNVFDDSRGSYAYFAYPPTGIVRRNNTIRLRPGSKIRFQDAQTIEQSAAWVAATGAEIGSTFTVLPA